MRAPRAFSIIELLTALVLLVVGLAAFVRAAGAIARLESDTRLRRAVAEVLRARLDTLRAAPCGATTAGTAVALGVEERWHAVAADGRTQFTDSVVVVGRPALSRTLEATVACLP